MSETNKILYSYYYDMDYGWMPKPEYLDKILSPFTNNNRVNISNAIKYLSSNKEYKCADMQKEQMKRKLRGHM